MKRAWFGPEPFVRATEFICIIFATCMILYAVLFLDELSGFGLNQARHDIVRPEPEALIPILACPNATFKQNGTFTFDTGLGFKVEESLGPHFGLDELVGKIHVTHGEPDQSTSIQVDVFVGSSLEQQLDTIDVVQENEALLIRPFEASYIPSRPQNSSCTYVIVRVAIKPHLLLWRNFNISSTVLPIEFAKNLDFEGYHVFASSTTGSIASSELLSFTAHEMTVHTTTGTVFGNWSLGSSLIIEGGSGAIDIDLSPKQWSSGPWTGGDLAVSSNTGNISIRMPFAKDTLSMRNYTTIINSTSGSIRGSLVHGAHAYLSTGGSIDVDVLPYYVLHEPRSNLTTSGGDGRHEVRVWPPVDSRWVGDESNVTVVDEMDSTHRQRSGKMKLRYPENWSGKVNGCATHGVFSVDESFKNVSRQHECVSAERGTGRSNMRVEIENGDAEVVVSHIICMKTSS